MWLWPRPAAAAPIQPLELLRRGGFDPQPGTVGLKDLALPQLWHRIQSLARELPYATCVAVKKKKKKDFIAKFSFLYSPAPATLLPEENNKGIG